MWSPPHANSITWAKIPPVQCRWPVNFGLCQEPNSASCAVPRVPPSSVTARKPLSMMLVPYGAGWDWSCPQIAISLETTPPS
jgi:hypothetical protein